MAVFLYVLQSYLPCDILMLISVVGLVDIPIMSFL